MRWEELGDCVLCVPLKSLSASGVTIWFLMTYLAMAPLHFAKIKFEYELKALFLIIGLAIDIIGMHCLFVWGEEMQSVLYQERDGWTNVFMTCANFVDALHPDSSTFGYHAQSKFGLTQSCLNPRWAYLAGLAIIACPGKVTWMTLALSSLKGTAFAYSCRAATKFYNNWSNLLWANVLIHDHKSLLKSVFQTKNKVLWWWQL